MQYVLYRKINCVVLVSGLVKLGTHCVMGNITGGGGQTHTRTNTQTHTHISTP